MSPDETVAILLLEFSLIFHVGFGIMFFLYRSDSGILIRHFLFTEVANLILMLLAIDSQLYSLLGSENYPRWAEIHHWTAAVAFAGGPYILRNWVLFFKFQMADEALKHKSLATNTEIRRMSTLRKRLNSDDGTSALFGFFTRNSFLITSKVLVPAQVSWITLVYLLVFSLQESQVIVLSIFSAMILAGGVAFWLLLRHRADRWNISKELFWILVGMFVFGTLYGIITAVPSVEDFISQKGNRSLRSLVGTITFTYFAYYTVANAVFSARKTRRLIRKQGLQDPELKKLTFKEFLQSPANYAAFEKFAYEELAIENLLFIKDVDEFRSKLVDSEKLLSSPSTSKTDKENLLTVLVEDARFIYKRYVADYATMQVNISSGTRAAMDKHFNMLKGNRILEYDDQQVHSMFEKAFHDSYDEVMNLMERDKFPRFRVSKYFAELKLDNIRLTCLEEGVNPLANSLGTGTISKVITQK